MMPASSLYWSIDERDFTLNSSIITTSKFKSSSI